MSSLITELSSGGSISPASTTLQFSRKRCGEVTEDMEPRKRRQLTNGTICPSSCTGVTLERLPRLNTETQEHHGEDISTEEYLGVLSPLPITGLAQMSSPKSSSIDLTQFSWADCAIKTDEIHQFPTFVLKGSSGCVSFDGVSISARGRSTSEWCFSKTDFVESSQAWGDSEPPASTALSPTLAIPSPSQPLSLSSSPTSKVPPVTPEFNPIQARLSTVTPSSASLDSPASPAVPALPVLPSLALSSASVENAALSFDADAISSVGLSRRRGKLPKATTDYLKAWLARNVDHPYPSDEEKRGMCQVTGLNMNQVSNWMINARRRIIAPARVQSFAASLGLCGCLARLGYCNCELYSFTDDHYEEYYRNRVGLPAINPKFALLRLKMAGHHAQLDGEKLKTGTPAGSLFNPFKPADLSFMQAEGVSDWWAPGNDNISVLRSNRDASLLVAESGFVILNAKPAAFHHD
ncbi:hypothetical protein FISHEDRAFT_59824 [Fistulina hepatica ATCC 64428]|uniref:Homeobox domain-containing protein n=1 Tax=Fistulina hepatica ATCC 64428 TaxID=1128425 RepID=A0A0D7A8P9_9AGAR|nr:hypothetical protein FISHEDRAFT_59824 [Fistulina hepatica ATCC 64428]